MVAGGIHVGRLDGDGETDNAADSDGCNVDDDETALNVDAHSRAQSHDPGYDYGKGKKMLTFPVFSRQR